MTTLAKVLVALLFGFCVGAVSSYYLADPFFGSKEAWVDFMYQAYLSERAQDAFLRESPQVARWELENQVAILNELIERKKGDEEYLERVNDRLYTAHVELAVVSAAMENGKAYQEHLDRALELAGVDRVPDEHREEETKRTVEKLLSCYLKRENRDGKGEADRDGKGEADRDGLASCVQATEKNR